MTKQNETSEQVAYKSTGQEEPINWLEGWSATEDKAINSTKVNLGEGFEVYVRGWLAVRNAERGENYVIEKFEIKEVIGSPGKFTVNVLLNPPVTRPAHDDEEEDGPVGGHLIPPAPPPPGG